LMFLIEKNASGAISNEEFKLFKNTWKKCLFYN
jgi:hypothetical protein